MPRYIDATDLVRRVLVERDKIPLEVVQRYSFGVPEPYRHGQAMRGGIRKAPEEAVTKGRGAYDRIQREFNDLFDAIHQMSDGWKEKYRKVCAKGLHMMAEKLEG